jgi:hypothetical protein
MTTRTEDPAVETAATEDTQANPPEPQDADGLMKALRSERELRKAEKKRANAAEAERDSLAEKLTTAETRLADVEKAEEQSIRVAVASEAGLDPKLAPRLQGSTREELEADAKEIASAIGGSGGSGGLDGGARSVAPTKLSPEEQNRRFIAAAFEGKGQTEAEEAAGGLWN